MLHEEAAMPKPKTVQGTVVQCFEGISYCRWKWECAQDLCNLTEETRMLFNFPHGSHVFHSLPSFPPYSLFEEVAGASSAWVWRPQMRFGYGPQRQIPVYDAKFSLTAFRQMGKDSNYRNLMNLTTKDDASIKLRDGERHIFIGGQQRKSSINQHNHAHAPLPISCQQKTKNNEQNLTWDNTLQWLVAS